MSSITEHEVAAIVVDIACEQRDGVATFNRIRRELPRRYSLSGPDLVWSTERPNEQMWEQRIRNIKSHDNVAGNFICEGYLEHVPRTGYRVTARGRALARRHAA